MPQDVVVVAVARTPFGRFGGMLAEFAGPQLGSLTIDETLRRSALPPDRVEAAYVGVGMIASGTLTPARQAVLQSALPETTPSLTVDRACCSGMTAIGIGFREIRSGCAQAVICGGFESLSQTPLFLPRQRSPKPGRMVVDDPLVLGASVVKNPIAVYTGEEALRHGVDREEQDAWAVASHERYFAADRDGYFDFERFAVATQERTGAPVLHEKDESPRPDTSRASLAKLKTVYGSPTITPGNAPGLNDGAAFALLVSEDRAQEHGLPVLARIRDYIQVADGPTSGSYTPAIGIAQILGRNAFDMRDVDLVEINEAYAATPLVSTLRLADGNRSEAEEIRAKTNVHGGAVAIGHPLGASGARLLMTLVNGLRCRGGGRGVAAICGGFGQGDALLVEVDR